MAKPRKVKSSGRPQKSALTDKGHEIPDSAPYSPALKLRRAASLRENIRDILRSEAWNKYMAASGEETFEEADDFDVDDDFDPSSPYEEFFEGEYSQLREARVEEKKDITKRRKAAKSAKEKEAAEVKKRAEEGGQTPPKAPPA